MDINARRRHSSLKKFMGADIALLIGMVMSLSCIVLFGGYVKLQEKLKTSVELKIHERDLEELAKQAEKAESWEDLQEQLKKAQRLLAQLKLELDEKTLSEEETQRSLKKLKAEIDYLRQIADTPPIFTLAETQGFHFVSGSAEIPDSFYNRLKREIIPKIRETMERMGGNTILVEGHTDLVPFNTRKSANLDTELIYYMFDEGYQPPQLVSSSNTELAMARAAAVARLLRNAPELKNYIVRPLSAGQTTALDGRLNVPDDRANASLRRIDIRLTRTRR